jgi:hypothetical protein
MAGLSRLKDGVAAARLVPAIHVLNDDAKKQDVDARTSSAKTRFALLPGHDGVFYFSMNRPEAIRFSSVTGQL